MKRTAEVQRDAKIGEAEAKKDSGIKVTCTVIGLEHLSITFTGNGGGTIEIISKSSCRGVA